MKKLIGFSLLLLFVTLFIAACNLGSSGASSATGNTVDLNLSSFARESITIQKGQSITLVNQTATTHVIANGTWEVNTPDPLQEAGAPLADNIIFDSANQSQMIGPFNAVGTFHYYCTIHTDMSLVVIVQ